LGLGENILLNGGTSKNPNISVHQSHFKLMGQFLINNIDYP